MGSARKQEVPAALREQARLVRLLDDSMRLLVEACVQQDADGIERETKRQSAACGAWRAATEALEREGDWTDDDARSAECALAMDELLEAVEALRTRVQMTGTLIAGMRRTSSALLSVHGASLLGYETPQVTSTELR